jgi:hypothetical protein
MYKNLLQLYSTGKGFVYRLNKELKTLNSKRTNNPNKKWASE